MKPASRRIVCILLALLLLGSLAVSAFAADPPTTNSTTDGSTFSTVTYTGIGTESWTVTVPATLPADGTTKGKIVISGYWPSNRQIEITAPATVELESKILSSDKVTVKVNFSTITQSGSNTAQINETKTDVIYISKPESTTLVGTWEGILTYAIAIKNVTP